MGKNYLIIGATSGIGEACVHKLASDSDHLLLVGRNKDKLEALEQQYAEKAMITPICHDLMDLDHMDIIFDEYTENQIKLDGMVYSAGMDGTWPIKVNNTKQMVQMMTVNCFAFVETARKFYSTRVSKEASSIIAISSTASLMPDVGMSSYSASKAALNSYVKTMAKEFIRRKIRVNAILPGAVSTPMTKEKENLLTNIASTGKQFSSASDHVQQLGLIPSDIIAAYVEFLLSDQSYYTTGELITIGAGRVY